MVLFLRNCTFIISPRTYLVDISERFLVLYQHLGKLGTLVCVETHDVTQQEDIVWRVAYFLGIKHNLLELASLGETLDHL